MLLMLQLNITEALEQLPPSVLEINCVMDYDELRFIRPLRLGHLTGDANARILLRSLHCSRLTYPSLLRQSRC
jgi:hypothetical protein